MSHNITVEGGTSVRLPTAGKYCDRDIVITATGSAAEVTLQSKTVTPSKSTQEVKADAGYTGLEKVTVSPIPSEYIIPSGTKTITENGTYDATAYASVSVNVPSKTPVLQEKTVTPATDAQTVAADSGYDGLSKVTVNAMPTANQALPTITVDNSGLILATAEQQAGYVVAGTRTGMKQLTTQAGKTVTPSKSEQTVVESGRYTTGAVKVAAIPDSYIQPSGSLDITENGTHDVKNYASVNVNVEGGGGGEIKPDPSKEYQRIEYIESTTSCLIETDIFADNETGMELTAKYPTLADRVTMGSRLDASATRFYTPYPLSANSFYYGFNSGVTKSTGAVANTLYRSSLNFLNNRVSTVKEEETNAMEFADILTSTLATQTAPIGIFCYLRKNDAGEFYSSSSRDIIFYNARISQGREIVREYFPCYRKSDGEIGLYEKFTGRFLTNQGTGTFTKGKDVDW